MNFDCSCSRFSQKSVSNMLDLLINGDRLGPHIKAGIARILNTILRNNNDNVLQHPKYLRMYEKQSFKASRPQSIISPSDVHTLIYLTGSHFQALVQRGSATFTAFDSEIIRLLAFLIESELIFSEGFSEGMRFVEDIFANVGHLVVSSMQEKNIAMVSRRSSVRLKGQGGTGNTGNAGKIEECSLNIEDFGKQCKKLKYLW